MGGLGALWIVGWLGLWTIPTPSVPLPDTLELLWQAPAECPDERAVRANIVESLEGLVGPTRAVNAEGIVEATLIEDTRGYRLILTITLADTTIRRQIRARDCALLARTTGLVVGLALDPAVEVETIASPMDEQVDDAEVLEPQAPLVPEEPADDRSPPISEPSTTSREDRDDAVIDRPGDPEPLPTSRPPVDIAVRLAGGLDVGLLPIGGGLDLSIALVGPRWRAEGHGSHWFARTAVFEREPEVGANLASWSGGGRGCWVPVPSRRIEIPICAGAELAQVRATGFGASINLQTRDVWAAATLASGAIWLPRPWLGLVVGADGFVALRRPGLIGQNRPELHRAAAVALRVIAGVELRAGRRATPRRKKNFGAATR